MEAASTRLLSPSRRLLLFSPLRNPNPNLRFPILPKLPSCPRNVSRPALRLSLSSPAPRRHNNPFFLSLSTSASASANQELTTPPNLDSGSKSSDLGRNHSDRGDLGFGVGKGEKKPGIWTVVLLGWLGAEEKHLKRYAEVYGAMGMRTVRFVVPVGDTMGLDLCKNVERRIAGLAEEVDRFCKEEEEDGRPRYLVFHTFSNTGWLV